MIIGFDGSRAFVTHKTGTENYSYQLLLHLAKIDKVNHYKVFLRSGNVLPKHLVWPKNFQFITLPYQYLWTQIGLSIQTFVEQLDVLFVPSHTIPLIYKPGLKTVVTVHDLGSEYLPSTHQIKQRLYLSLMQNYQLENATRIIAVSKATKEDLIHKIHLQANKIDVVYEGYDQKLYSKAKSKNDTVVNILKYYEIKKDSYFLFVGTVQPRKNLTRLISAFHNYVARGPDSPVSPRTSSLVSPSAGGRMEPSSASPLATEFKLVIVGKKGWMSDEIYALPKKLGIEDQVKFLDYVKFADLPALYSGAIALVFPSLFEGFGLPILEAQASGCPVITSGVSSMPEVAGEDGAILVNPNDQEEIVKAMIKVRNQETRRKLVRNGFENVKKFSWEKCARETLQVLEKV